jgi:hypothetical protein
MVKKADITITLKSTLMHGILVIAAVMATMVTLPIEMCHMEVAYQFKSIDRHRLHI